MDKIDMAKSRYGGMRSKDDKLKQIKTEILNKTGFEPESIRYSNGNIVVKAKNNYEAIAIRMSLEKYLRENDIKVV